ncbi:MAG: hypothetical protein BGO01_11140 [Armatimonadetes bacterium 55-13]|nr:NmrA family transcriptional regulator [Armatimonadota bacterium]ODU51457.1 MAG: hypothetical protein ABT09_03840 [bacterium SCN 57-13]OJU63792.1 MAG: hypothetical protein BGO01_11140 [Armatimonadetes bacterium 55-13]
MVLITCGNGKFGRRLASHLRARRMEVRVGSRQGNPAFDWSDEASWEPALEGVSQVAVVYVPDLAIPGAAETVGRFAERARGRRLMLLSGRGEKGAQAAEAATLAVDSRATVLRCAWFSQNFSESFFQDGILDGELCLPVEKVFEPFVDLDDVAEVGAKALVEGEFLGEVLDLTGPQLMTFPQAVAEIAQAAGRDIGFRTVPLDEYASWISDADAQWLIRHLFAEVLDGRNAHLSDDLRRALGRDPRPFSVYARRATSLEAWRV